VAWDKACKEMRAKYTVLMPAPPPEEKNTPSPVANAKGAVSASSGKVAR
jgi:hypothetical protein